jgi:hypothetical protein
MTGGASCTSTSHSIQRACGLCGNCGGPSFGSAPRFLIFNRDRKYGVEVPAAVRSLGIEAIQTSFESPWQNGVAERWIESCRRELLDHIIALNERHLRRLLFDYVRYNHEDRTHLGLGKGTPAGRICSANAGRVISCDRLAGLSKKQPKRRQKTTQQAFAEAYKAFYEKHATTC